MRDVHVPHPHALSESQESGIDSKEEKSCRAERLPESQCSAPPAKADGKILGLLVNMIVIDYGAMLSANVWKEDSIPTLPQADERNLSASRSASL